MSRLTDEQVNLIARQVLSNLRKGETGNVSGKSTANATQPLVSGSGIFPDVNSAVSAAKQGFKELSRLQLKTREKIIANIRKRMLENLEVLSRKAHEETGLGRVEDKIIKNRLVTEKTPGIEALKPVSVTGDDGLTLLEFAPYGVIGAITPVTNPTSTIICNTIGMVAAGNAIVFNVHPSAKEVSILNIQLLNKAITEAGGPENLVTGVAVPTIESAGQLMKHPDVRLLVVTGGAGVVKAAMTSGKRAICAGPGNPPVVVDETADLEKAARDIVRGSSLDNNIICVLEKEAIVVDGIADELLSRMQNNGAIVLTKQQFNKLEKVIFTETHGPRRHGVIEKSLIGKNVQEILGKIGLHVQDNIRLAVAEVPEDHPLVWTEQMMPVLPFVRVRDADRAIELAIEAEQGNGHTAAMHSRNIENLSRMAREINCSIFVKNGPCAAGLGHGGEGHCSFSIASPTGEGVTGPLSFTRERRCVLVDHFRII